MKHVAVVDLGTNAMRLAIGQGSPSQYTLLKYIRYPNRLSQGMFSDGMLKQPAIKRTLDGIEDIKSILDAFHVDTFRMISTSVLRTAKNASQFVDLVRQKTGFNIEVISGTEEARFIHVGAVHGIDIDDKVSFVVDIGGGSTELSVGDRKNIQFAVSVESGAVRLRENFIQSDPPASGELNDIISAIDHDFQDTFTEISRLKPDIQIGVPGNIGTIYNTLKPVDGLTRESLKAFYKKLSAMTVEQIKSLTGLEEDKADILLPGLMILIRIMESVNINRCYLSQKGLLHGMMIHLLEE